MGRAGVGSAVCPGAVWFGRSHCHNPRAVNELGVCQDSNCSRCGSAKLITC